jgi:hypothetical protein
MSDWVYGWSQFIDHDLDLTTTGDTAFDIRIPQADLFVDPPSISTAVIYFWRAIYDPDTGTAAPNVLHINYQPNPAHRPPHYLGSASFCHESPDQPTETNLPGRLP